MKYYGLKLRIDNKSFIHRINIRYYSNSSYSYFPAERPNLTIITQRQSTGNEGLDAELKNKEKIANCEHTQVFGFIAGEEANKKPIPCDMAGDDINGAEQVHNAAEEEGDLSYVCDYCHGIICEYCRVEYSDDEVVTPTPSEVDFPSPSQVNFPNHPQNTNNPQNANTPQDTYPCEDINNPQDTNASQSTNSSQNTNFSQETATWKYTAPSQINTKPIDKDTEMSDLNKESTKREDTEISKNSANNNSVEDKKKSKESLLDDYADPSTEMPDYFGWDD